MSDKTTNLVFEKISIELDIPKSAYEKTKGRYEDLGAYFEGPNAKCSKYDPHVYPQGSFRFGTVIRPLNESAEYDLDLGFRLRSGITKETHSQKELKELVGYDLEAYRKARQISSPLDELNRCWRLSYKDEMSFHLDAVPSIPQEEEVRRFLKEAMVKSGSDKYLAENVASLAGAITDRSLPNYKSISSEWRISNSEGYALWFESRMKLAVAFTESRALRAKVAQIDNLPAYEWDSPLQQAIKILKRHRDVMFEDDPDCQPISIIITTLAAAAYQGENNVGAALKRILDDMESYVQPGLPRVPNPVNPDEDFADKWDDPNYRDRHLERNFRRWVNQARSDFQILANLIDVDEIAVQAQEKFRVNLSRQTLQDAIGLSNVSVVTRQKTQQIETVPAKPWAIG